MPLTAAVLSLSPSMVTAGAANYPPSALALRVGFGRPPQAVPRGPGVAALAGRRYGIGSAQFSLDSPVKPHWVMGSNPKLASCMNGETDPLSKKTTDHDFSETMAKFRSVVYPTPHGEPEEYVPRFENESEEDRKIRLKVAETAEMCYKLVLSVGYHLQIEKHTKVYMRLEAVAQATVVVAKRSTLPESKPAGLLVTLAEILNNLRRAISAATSKPLPSSTAPEFNIEETRYVDFADALIMILVRFFATVKYDIETMLPPWATGRSA